MNQEIKPEGRTTKVVDLKIPLVWLISISGALAWVLISMWFTLNQLVAVVADLQITVKAGSTSYSVLASEQALINYRMGTVEAQLKALKGAAP
jgi:hypothetical protein